MLSQIACSSMVLLVVCGACAAPGPGPIVSAPSSSSSSEYGSAAAPAPSPQRAAIPPVCGQPWTFDAMGGDARVVVVCANDVRRQPLDESGETMHALSPGLAPARERVCACAGKLAPPAFVDLVFTAKPEDGRVTVQASGDQDLDPELGPAFVACVGTVSVTFAPRPSDACSGAGKVSFVYPVRLDLAP